MTDDRSFFDFYDEDENEEPAELGLAAPLEEHATEAMPDEDADSHDPLGEGDLDRPASGLIQGGLAIASTKGVVGIVVAVVIGVVIVSASTQTVDDEGGEAYPYESQSGARNAVGFDPGDSPAFADPARKGAAPRDARPRDRGRDVEEPPARSSSGQRRNEQQGRARAVARTPNAGSTSPAPPPTRPAPPRATASPPPEPSPLVRAATAKDVHGEFGP